MQADMFPIPQTSTEDWLQAMLQVYWCWNDCFWNYDNNCRLSCRRPQFRNLDSGGCYWRGAATGTVLVAHGSVMAANGAKTLVKKKVI